MLRQVLQRPVTGWYPCNCWDGLQCVFYPAASAEIQDGIIRYCAHGQIGTKFAASVRVGRGDTRNWTFPLPMTPL